MTQTWRIGRVTESTDEFLDPVQVFSVVYEGRGRLKSVQATTVREGAPASQLESAQVLELHLPVGTAGVEIDMRAVCVACPEDPSLVGRVVRVKGAPSAGQVTAARFSVVESGERILGVP